MPEEISRLLEQGTETIVRNWTQKVTTDRRVQTDSQLTYLQLVDHVPEIVKELRQALIAPKEDGHVLEHGREHGRQRWRQGYDLKEVVRELALLRATLMEFIDTYRGALMYKSPEVIELSYRKINGFIDEEIYRSVEAYLNAPGEPKSGDGAAA